MLKSAPGEIVVTAGTLAPKPPIPPEEITGPGMVIEKLAGVPSAVAVTATGPLAGPIVTAALASPIKSVGPAPDPRDWLSPARPQNSPALRSAPFPSYLKRGPQ